MTAAVLHAIPELGLRLGNDSPVWLTPRRIVWGVVRDGRYVDKANGALLLYPTQEAASRAMVRLAARMRANPK